MPIYPVKCPSCGSAWEQFSSMSERDAIACQCGQCPVDTDYRQLKPRNADREFCGSQQESQLWFFRPSEVKAARQALGESGNCIRDDGKVVFTRRSEERAFATKMANLRNGS